MRTLRLILAVLLMASLTISPVAAGMGATHAAKTEMSIGASGGDCPCCNAAKKCATDTCMFTCYSVPVLSVEGLPLIEPLPKAFVAVGLATFSPFSPRPDPPPPRS